MLQRRCSDSEAALELLRLDKVCRAYIIPCFELIRFQYKTVVLSHIVYLIEYPRFIILIYQAHLSHEVTTFIERMYIIGVLFLMFAV